ncbi:helicase-associated domain-containing protein [Brevibacillus borstelensis]|uniref:helicase-associated domain-containing protein n=1 Tax=Brevibacillus TaxID=55080 RepID=UPI001FA9959D|nr:helicase-associated domain-containing protein [Brevibacillus borstelensis]
MRILQGVEFLSQTTQEHMLEEHAKRFGIKDGRTLTDLLTDPLFIDTYWKQADDSEKKVIRLFVTTAARGFLRKKDWEKIVLHQGRILSVGLNKLRRLGFILTVRKMWGEIGYMMPKEVRERLTLCLITERHCTPAPAKTLPYYITAGRGIHLDLFGVLSFLRETDVPLTVKGSIHRRILQKMTPLLTLSDEHVEGWASYSIPESKEGEMALAVVIDLAIRLGLIRARGGQLVLEKLSVAKWLEKGQEARWNELFQLIAEEYLPHDSWWDGLLVLMMESKSDEWHSINDQIKTLADTGFRVPDDAASLAVTRWLHLLLGFGWLHMGTTAEGEVYWRWNSLPRLAIEERWFIDPAGVLTIPPLVPLKAVWEVSRFCPLVFTGDLIQGELQAKPLQSYLAAGGKEEDAMDILQQYCAHPLPESIGQMIRQWGREARQIQFEPMVRVRTAHPGILEELKTLEQFRPFLGFPISSTDFLIAPEQEKEVTALLRKYGYTPYMPKKSTEDQAARSHAAEGGPDGLFTIPRPWDGFAVENTFPDSLEGMHQLSSLPKMWTQHFQSYHPQTMRTLLQRASELGLEIEAEMQDKKVRAGIPRQVSIEMGYWYVFLEVGNKKQRCRLDDIHRVRIVLPEYLY